MSVELVTTSTCSNQWSKAKGAAPFDVTANPVGVSMLRKTFMYKRIMSEGLRVHRHFIKIEQYAVCRDASYPLCGSLGRRPKIYKNELERHTS
jgi:hypothetical protein